MEGEKKKRKMIEEIKNEKIITNLKPEKQLIEKSSTWVEDMLTEDARECCVSSSS